jgi:predicted dehydrogenase
MAACDVLVVGCGNIAGGFDARRPAGEWPLTHAGAFSRHRGFHLAACVEPDAQRREAFMARWQVPLGFATMGEAASAKLQPCVVSICSPTAAHNDDLASALALRPRAIFCEKPVTLSVAQTLHWVRACETADVLLAVNHTRRWAPDVVHLKEQLSRGEWGAVRSLTGWYNKGILNNGGHLIDLAGYLLGRMTLLAAGPAVHDFWPDDPTTSALLQTASDIPVMLCSGHAADYSLFEMELVTEHGVLIMENGGMNWRVRQPAESPHFEGYRSLGAAQERSGEYSQAMSAAVANLHDALTHGAALASTGRTALEAQQLCEQIRDAAYRKS